MSIRQGRRQKFRRKNYMCGIAGILHFDTNRKVETCMLEKMTRVLHHRGPDGEGIFASKNIGMGHRRLAVIDLATGQQPMFSEDKKLAIVFNGEIYNYLELKSELEAVGHTFHTTGDTEVILCAYQQWGFECQEKFNGMWAFAIWDSREQHLFISRDRIGEKPLFFSLRDNSLLFASEIKSILAAGYGYDRNDRLWDIFLSLGYVPAPYTFYKDICKLMPGHYLSVRGGVISERPYWSLPSVDEREMRRDTGKILEEFEALFSDSVRIRMRCDVPYGAFLSGGLDSSSVVAAMAASGSKRVRTFTIGFVERSFDERELAGQVVQRFRTEHSEEITEAADFDESLQKILFHFDEPFGDASAVPVGLVSRLARRKVTVALTGDGGDEVLSGYPSYLNERFAHAYRRVPRIIREGVYRSARMLSTVSRGQFRYRANRLTRVLRAAGQSFDNRFLSKLAAVSRGSVRELVANGVPQLSTEEYLEDVFSRCTFRDPFYRLMYFQFMVSLPDDMLAKVDRMSMAHSLETRVPFLDHRLIELTYGVDKRIKTSGYHSKYILKQTYAKRLPQALVKAPKKSLRVPLREWFKQKDFDGRLEELQRIDFGLDRRIIREIVESNRTGREDYGDFIWRLFVLQRWSCR